MSGSPQELDADLKVAVQVLYRHVLNIKMETEFSNRDLQMDARKGSKKGRNLLLSFRSFCAKLFHYFFYSLPLVSAVYIQTSQNVTPKQVKRI